MSRPHRLAWTVSLIRILGGLHLLVAGIGAALAGTSTDRAIQVVGIDTVAFAGPIGLAAFVIAWLVSLSIHADEKRSSVARDR